MFVSIDIGLGWIYWTNNILFINFFDLVDDDHMLSRKLSCIQSVLTGFSSFNMNICSQFVPLLGKLLREVENVDVCFTSIKCLGFLCRK